MTAKKQKLEIHKMLTISTGHITEHDAKILEKGSWISDEYCFILGTSEELVSHYEENGLSGSFLNCLKFARDNDCNYIRFDADGDEIEGLKIYEW